MIRILHKSIDSQSRSILFKQCRYKHDSNRKTDAENFTPQSIATNVDEDTRNSFPEENNQYNPSTNKVQQQKTSPLNVSWQRSLSCTKKWNSRRHLSFPTALFLSPKHVQHLVHKLCPGLKLLR